MSEKIFGNRNPERDAFLKQYKYCANANTLRKIWKAKEGQAKVLYLREESITDLSPLKNLFHLQKLDVSNTQVNDLSPLKDLVDLEMLDVSNTQVNNLTPIKNHFKNPKFIVECKNCPLTTPPKAILTLGIL